MVKLTPEEDSALYEELRPELPKVEKTVEKMDRQLKDLSDIGQITAVAEVTVGFILRHVNDEEEALSVSEHLHGQVDILLKQVFRAIEEAPSSEQ